MSEDRFNANEQPTPRRLQKAREEGQVARSNDLSSVLFLLVAVGTMLFLAPYIARTSKNFVIESLSFSKNNPTASLESAGWQLVEMVAIPCIVLFVGAAFASLLQVGGLFSPKIIAPRFSRLGSGPKKIFGARSRMTLLFSLSKIILAVLAGLLVVLHYQNQLLSLSEQSLLPRQISNAVLIGSQTVFASLAVLFVLGICDFGWQRYAWKRDLLMTRQEIIEEHREHNAKANEARMHSTWIARRSTDEIVPSLVVAGTKLAVSLRWNASTMTAPIVLDIFKGEPLMPKLEQLRKEGVAVVENNVLAHEISQGSNAGLGIPSILHGEIASVLINLKRNIR